MGARRELFGGDAHTTNNRMELMAAIVALEALKRACDVDLHTDSEYLQQGITAGSTAGSERLADRRQKAGQERGSVAAPGRRSPGTPSAGIGSSGHAGHDLNERADELARAAIAEIRARHAAPVLRRDEPGNQRFIWSRCALGAKRMIIFRRREVQWCAIQIVHRSARLRGGGSMTVRERKLNAPLPSPPTEIGKGTAQAVTFARALSRFDTRFQIALRPAPSRRLVHGVAGVARRLPDRDRAKRRLERLPCRRRHGARRLIPRSIR